MLKTENQVYLKLQPFVLELIEAGFIGGDASRYEWAKPLTRRGDSVKSKVTLD